MASSEDLPVLYRKALGLYEVAKEGDGNETDISAAIAAMEECIDIVRQANLYSKGELINEITTQALQYFVLDFYRAHLFSFFSSPETRLPRLETSMNGMLSFLEKCRDAEAPSSIDITG